MTYDLRWAPTARASRVGVGGVAQGREEHGARDHHRDQVRHEEQQGPQRQRDRPLAQADADHRERRHERDGDGDAGQHRRDVAPGQPDGTGEAGRDRRDEVDTVGEVRPVICELVCRSMSGTTKAATTPMSTTTIAPKRTNRPGPDPLALHDAEGDAHDRRRERGDDHRPDDRGRGVGEHARGRDDPREHEHRPERRLLRAGVARPQVEVVGQLVEGAPLVLGQDAVPQTDVHAAEYAARRRGGSAGPGGRARASRAVPSGRTRVPSTQRAIEREEVVMRRSRTTTVSTVAVLSFLALALAGCSDDGPPTPMPTQSSTAPTSSPSPSASASTGTPSPTSSATPSGTASVPAGFSLDEVSSTALPEPRWRPRGDRRGAGRPAHRLRPGGVAVPGHRAARRSRCTTSTSRSATAAATSSTCAGDAYLEVVISSWASPPASAPRPRTPPAPRSPAPSSRRRARLRRVRGRRPGLRRGARPPAAVQGRRAHQPDPARGRRLLGLTPLPPVCAGQRRSSSRCQDWVR